MSTRRDKRVVYTRYGNTRDAVTSGLVRDGYRIIGARRTGRKRSGLDEWHVIAQYESRSI